MKFKAMILAPIFFVVIVFLSSTFLTSIGGKFLASSFVQKSFQHFPTELLLYTIGTESHFMHSFLPEENKIPKASSIIFQFATNLRPWDVRSFLGREIPGFFTFDGEIYIAGKGTNYTNLPIESSPPMDELLQDSEIDEAQLITEQQNENIVPENSTEGRKVLYIYHSHSYESFKPLLKDGAVNSSNEKVNVIAVGKKMSEELEKRGIGVIQEGTNMTEALHNRGWNANKAYILSRELVVNALANNSDLTDIIDIHRDSQPRNVTTTTINGEEYARLFFVVGKEHPDYEKKLQLAEELNNRLENKYPTISRGVMIKSKFDGNGLYNQDLAPNALLLEVGGVDNNLEELYRTAEAFADIFSEYYWEAEKVNY